MSEQSTPKIYAAIAAVQAAIAKEGIGKDRKNEQQGYKFRGIDDIFNALAPLLAANGVCVMPTYANRTKEERTSKGGGVLFNVTVEGTFDFVSTADGSKHVVKTFGEAMDSGDKATNKAMSAAYKYACIQTFCIPTEGDNDADSTTHEVVPVQAAPVNPAPAPPRKLPTANTRAWAINQLDAGEGMNDVPPGDNREPLTNYLRAIGWLDAGKVLEQWPLQFVPDCPREIAKLQLCLNQYDLDSTKPIKPYQPHTSGMEIHGTPVTPAPKPDANGWAGYLMPTGKHKGKPLGQVPVAELEFMWANFTVRETVDTQKADGEIVSEPVAADVLAKQKALRTMLDLAGQELQFKKEIV